MVALSFRITQNRGSLFRSGGKRLSGYGHQQGLDHFDQFRLPIGLFEVAHAPGGQKAFAGLGIRRIVDGNDPGIPSVFRAPNLANQFHPAQIGKADVQQGAGNPLPRAGRVGLRCRTSGDGSDATDSRA